MQHPVFNDQRVITARVKNKARFPRPWQLQYYYNTSTFIMSTCMYRHLQMYLHAFNSSAWPGAVGPGLDFSAGFYHREGQNKKSRSNTQAMWDILPKCREVVLVAMLL